MRVLAMNGSTTLSTPLLGARFAPASVGNLDLADSIHHLVQRAERDGDRLRDE